MTKRGFAYDATTAETDVRNAPSRYARRLLRPMHRGRLFEAARDAALALSAAARAHLRRDQALKAALVDSVLECSGDALLVDSSKLGVQLKCHLRNPRLDVRVLWLVRDGRAVARSLTQNERMTMREAAREWRRFYEEGAAVVRGLARAQWTQVRYETLCAEPEATLAALWRFLGLPARAPESPAREDFHVLGHDTRLRGLVRLRPGENEKWREQLSAAELRTFEAIAGRENRALGYA
jgi:hypothetical protein